MEGSQWRRGKAQACPDGGCRHREALGGDMEDRHLCGQLGTHIWLCLVSPKLEGRTKIREAARYIKSWPF